MSLAEHFRAGRVEYLCYVQCAQVDLVSAACIFLPYEAVNTKVVVIIVAITTVCQ